MNKRDNNYILITLIVILCLIILGLLFYIVRKNNINSKYTYDNLEGYYELVDENNPDNVIYQLLLFNDGSFQIEETNPYAITVGNYLIENDKVNLNFQLGFGGGYPQPIYSLSETKELAIQSPDTLIGKNGKYVKNKNLKDSKLIKISFDGEKHNIIDVDNYK